MILSNVLFVHQLCSAIIFISLNTVIRCEEENTHSRDSKIDVINQPNLRRCQIEIEREVRMKKCQEEPKPHSKFRNEARVPKDCKTKKNPQSDRSSRTNSPDRQTELHR